MKNQGICIPEDVVKRFRALKDKMIPMRGYNRVSVGEALTRLMDFYEKDKKEL